MFSFQNAAKKLYQAARAVLQPLFGAAKQEVPTQRELRLDADEWAVKRKLGHGFFTRSLTHNTRVARLMTLTEPEFELARRRGWVPRDSDYTVMRRMKRALKQRIRRNNEARP
jgi:hypothetical protein